jgi:hypothetical protein
MKFNPEAPKRLAIFFWIVGVSIFLYFFAVSLKPEPSVSSFWNFVILMWGGSVAYHVTTELIKCPYNGGNKHLWKALLVQVAKVFVGYIIVALGVVPAKLLGGDWGYVLAFLGLVFGYLWAMHYLVSLEKPIREIASSSNKAQHGDR